MNDRARCFIMVQCIVLAVIVTGITCIGQADQCNKNDGHCNEPKKLSDIMWTKSLETANKAYGTPFVQKLIAGNLDPTKFGAYIIQDAVYLEKQSDALMIASHNESSMQFREFLTGKAIKNMG